MNPFHIYICGTKYIIFNRIAFSVTLRNKLRGMCGRLISLLVTYKVTGGCYSTFSNRLQQNIRS